MIIKIIDVYVASKIKKFMELPTYQKYTFEHMVIIRNYNGIVDRDSDVCRGKMTGYWSDVKYSVNQSCFDVGKYNCVVTKRFSKDHKNKRRPTLDGYYLNLRNAKRITGCFDISAPEFLDDMTNYILDMYVSLRDYE